MSEQQNNSGIQQIFATDNEQMFYSQWKNSEREMKYLADRIAQLQRKLKGMQDSYAKKLLEQSDYHTDEEELAKETEWIRIKSRKNKKTKMDT